MADGNFKADHVRQKNEDGDVWLSEGSGMIPKRDEYLTFLASAIERLTVSKYSISRTGAGHTIITGAGYIIILYWYRFYFQIQSRSLNYIIPAPVLK